jgi:hypothetical protein
MTKPSIPLWQLASIAGLLFASVDIIRSEEPRPAKMEQLRLYIPIPELETRVGTDVESLAAYVKSLEKTAAGFLQKETKPQAKGLLIAVGISGSKKAKVWCQAVDGDCPSKLLTQLQDVLAQVEPVTLKRPPMAFGMEMSLWGKRPQKYPEFPETWVEAAKQSGTKLLIPPDELFKTLWPESVVAQTTDPSSVTFVPQMLEPIGGKIQRPKDWFYVESHKGSSYTWILSRENASKGPYTTGVKIQTFVGVKEATGKTPKEFVQDFVQRKKKEADKVLDTCAEKKQGLFTRVCLETREGPHHILYSLFWGNDDLDIVVVSIAGTTSDLWNTYSPVFDEMSGFELLDPKRFQK